MKNMTIAARLGWSFGALVAMLAGIAMVGILRLNQFNDAVDAVVNNRSPKLEALHDMSYRSMDNARIARNIILLTDEPGMAADKASFDKNMVANGVRLSYLKENLVDPEDQALLAAVADTRATYNTYIAEVIKLGLAHKSDDAIKLLYGEKYKTQADYFNALHNLADAQKLKLAGAATAAAQRYTSSRELLISLGALASVLGAGMALLIIRGLQRQLGGEPGYASDVAQRIAEGDLSQTVHVRAGDTTSLLAAMWTMQTSLAKVVTEVRQNSESVATASAQIAQGNNDLSSRTEQQAAALEQTAASMEELNSTVKQNADNARQANQLAQSASVVAVTGGDVVNQVVDTMKGINDSSRKIADIIGVIDGIAFQTNILALNAAVEAARAGEQGRGFAVVASEVRSLAGRSADAAKEIKSLISASVERVEQGSVLVGQAGVTMSEVVGSIKRVTDIMGEISAASAEQSSGVSQVGEAVTQMDRATQQNAALVEQSAAAAESMKVQARQLVQAVAAFKLGHDTHRPVAPTTPVAVKTTASQRPSPIRAQDVVRPSYKTAAPKVAALDGVRGPPTAAPQPGADHWQSF